MFWRSVSFGAAFILNILFARRFAAAATGSVFYLFTIFTFVYQFASLSLESGMGYYSAKKEAEGSEIMFFSLIWSLLSTTLVCLVIYFFFHAQYPISYPFCFIAGNMLTAFGNAYCYSKYKFVLPSLVAIVINAVLIILLLANECSKELMDPDKYISFYFYSFLIQGAILFAGIVLSEKKILLFVRIRAAVIQKIFRYSMQAFMANLVFLAVNRIDYIFVKMYCSAEDLGNYIQVSKVSQLFFILPSMISAVLFPLIASDNKHAVVSRVKLLSVGVSVVYFFICLVPAITGKWLFPFLFGSSFDNMYFPFLLLVPGILFMSFLYPYTAYFAGSNLIRVNLYGSLLALFFILVLDLLLIPGYGINAAAFVSSVGYFVYQAYVIKIFRSKCGMDTRSMFLLNREEWSFIKHKIGIGR